jgi:hypothetical protein
MPDIMGHVLLIAALYAAAVGGLRSFTLPALVAVLVPVAVLGVLAVTGRVPRRPVEDAGRWQPWLVPAAAFATLELLSLLVWHSDADHPSLSILLDRPLEHWPIRSLAVFGWLAAGIGLVRR